MKQESYAQVAGKIYAKGERLLANISLQLK